MSKPNFTVTAVDNVPTSEGLKLLSICAIARIIKKNWTKVYFGAVPYLDAMFSLDKITDNYFMDSGESVVIYFLANAQTWKGETAKVVKAELNRRVKALR